jgi:transcriptional regulator with XRE-family HTH domain
MRNEGTSLLHEALRLLRVFNDLKSVQLAERLGISPSYLSEIESGKKEPSLELIRKYAAVLNTTPSSLLFFSEELDKGKKNKNFKALLRRKTIRFLQRIEDAGTEELSHST